MAKRNSQLTELLIVAQDDYLTIVDTSAGQSKRVSVKNLTGLPDVGWTATGESWSFSSWTAASNTGVVTVPTDATTKYAVSMFVRFAQTTGGTKYAKILAVTATTLTLWMPGYTLNNEAITSPVYSPLAHPFGLPVAISDGNPYKASAYNASTVGIATSAQKVTLNTENFDTVAAFDAVTNYRFVAPVAGFYRVNAQVAFGSAGMGGTESGQAALYKNGSGVRHSQLQNGSGSATILARQPINTLIQLAAGDYLELYAVMSGVYRDIVGGSTITFMDVELGSRG